MITTEQYQELKQRLYNYEQWSERFRKKNGWIVIPADQTPPDNAVISNEERSQIELYEFHHNKPDRYFLYIKEDQALATTWVGNCLGKVTFKREYRSGFGDTRVSISVDGINGVKYHGTYYKSAGDYARVKACKGSGV